MFVRSGGLCTDHGKRQKVPPTIYVIVFGPSFCGNIIRDFLVIFVPRESLIVNKEKRIAAK